jgi:hypothetical protein
VRDFPQASNQSASNLGDVDVIDVTDGLHGKTGMLGLGGGAL